MAKYEFHNIEEIELMELKYPAIFQSSPAANAAAREYLERQLAHFSKMLVRTQRAAPGSILFHASTECKNKIVAIERWLNRIKVAQ